MILTNVKTTVDNLTLLSDGKPTFRLSDFTAVCGSFLLLKQQTSMNPANPTF